MPTYLFKCETCGLVVEIYASFTEPTHIPHCETCKTPTRKIIEAPAIHFKGTGFYKTGG